MSPHSLRIAALGSILAISTVHEDQPEFTRLPGQTAWGYDLFSFSGKIQNPAEISDQFQVWNQKRGDFCRGGEYVLVFSDGEQKYVQAVCDPEIFREPSELQPERYVPFSEEAAHLLEEAALATRLPLDWAWDPALHELLRRESQGYVGIPNLSIKTRDGHPAWRHPESWKDIHHLLQQGKWNSSRGRSTATGLGQLLLRHVAHFYPSGERGIGDAKEEAIGMMRYIAFQYGTPEQALEQHQRKKIY